MKFYISNMQLKNGMCVKENRHRSEVNCCTFSLVNLWILVEISKGFSYNSWDIISLFCGLDTDDRSYDTKNSLRPT